MEVSEYEENKLLLNEKNYISKEISNFISCYKI